MGSIEFGTRTVGNPVDYEKVDFQDMVEVIERQQKENKEHEKKIFVLQICGKEFDLIVTPKEHTKQMTLFLKMLKEQK